MEHVAVELGVPYRHLSTLQRELSVATDVATIAALRRLLRERPTEVLHTHTAKAGATGRLAALLAGRGRPRAVVHTYHGHVLRGYFDPARERAFRTIERALAHASDRLIAVSDEVRNDLVAFRVAPNRKIAVVPYGFDLDARVHSDAATRAGKRADAGAGDESAAEVEGSLLVLAGDGELREEVRTLADELGVPIRLLGYVDDLGDWYAAFDALLLTSLNEGAPVVAIEAQAAGVPVVATDAGGTRTVVADGATGFVVPIGDVGALAERLRRLRDDLELRVRLGDEGKRRMRAEFSVERMVDDVQRIYEEALAR